MICQQCAFCVLASAMLCLNVMTSLTKHLSQTTAIFSLHSPNRLLNMYKLYRFTFLNGWLFSLSCLFVFSFLLLWSAVLIMYPTTLAVIALTFSNYVLQPAFQNCLPPFIATKLLATICVCKHKTFWNSLMGILDKLWPQSSLIILNNLRLFKLVFFSLQ